LGQDLRMRMHFQPSYSRRLPRGYFLNSHPLCGRLADGLIVSNLCPPTYTARAVAIVRESAAVPDAACFEARLTRSVTRSG